MISYREIDEKIELSCSNDRESNWKNKFHIEMPFGLVNDPNGLSYYNGKYHIFYQWNPFGCEHKTKHWGLVTTEDFVTFSKPKIILKPEDYFDKNGCYSGCGLVRNDKIELYYTGNVKDENNERRTYQCLATYDKDGTIEKKGVIINKEPEGYTAHFRDPFIFKKNNMYYMILGVQNNDLKGRALIYSSKSADDWSLMGELETKLSDFGFMWECPNLLEVEENKFALIFSPQGLEAEEFKNQNIYQSGYVIGDLNLETLEFNHDEFKELDMGFDFYAPQIFKHDGRNIMFTWLGMPDKDNEYPTSKEGFIFSLSTPREVIYNNGVLYQKPLKELENLREEKIVDVNNITTKNYKINLTSRALEVQLNLDISNNDSVEVDFKFGDEKIVVAYDKINGVCIINRNNMNQGGRGVRKFKLKGEDKLKLHMFIDNSIMEIYFQDGIETTSFAYFPENNDMEIEIKDNKNFNIEHCSVWNLKGVKYE